ncbi:MAG: ABC transporter permease [Pseudoxanthomonas sp.]
MNAVATKAGSPANTFLWLLKREYWENRGGFVWAQLITGGIVVVLSILMAIVSVVTLNSSDLNVGRGEDADIAFSGVGDITLLMGSAITGTVVAFVVFFYALGSLYDDRRDRSALFWKSLPISDTFTVLSKAAWALLLAPLISVFIGMLIGLALWVVSAVTVMATGVEGASDVFTGSHPFRILGAMLATLPIGMLWSLPAVGWLMLCSAMARSKPFLWAVLLPLLACVIVSVMGALPGIHLPLGSIWYVVFYRGLLSVVPGMWVLSRLAYNETAETALNASKNSADSLQMVLHNLIDPTIYASLDLWIGAAVGVAFIALAIYARRWRDEA